MAGRLQQGVVTPQDVEAAVRRMAVSWTGTKRALRENDWSTSASR